MVSEQLVRNAAAVTGATSARICDKITLGYRRSQLIITNTSAAAVVTITKGSNPAVAGEGIRLNPSGSYLESTDSGFLCWQDEVQAISDVAGSVAIVETLTRV